MKQAIKIIIWIVFCLIFSCVNLAYSQTTYEIGIYDPNVAITDIEKPIIETVTVPKVTTTTISEINQNISRLDSAIADAQQHVTDLQAMKAKEVARKAAIISELKLTIAPSPIEIE